MFDNIGRKIKTLAKVLCWIEIISSIIVAIIMIYTSNTAFSYRESDSLAAVSLRASGVIMLFVGPLISWISSFVLYALGEITENSATQAILLKKLAQKENIDIVEEDVLENKKGTLPNQGSRVVLLVSDSLSICNRAEALLEQENIEYDQSGLLKVVIKVKRFDFSRARALLAEEFKDDPEALKSLSPETPSDN